MAELLIKVGNKYAPDDPAFSYGWKDGHVIAIRPDDYYTGRRTQIAHCVVVVPADYKLLTDKNGQLTEDAYKFINPAVDDKYAWDSFYDEEVQHRKRDWFVDFKRLLDLGLITQAQYERIRDKKAVCEKLFIDKALTDLFAHEDLVQRTDPNWITYKGTVSTGSFTVGTSQDYSDWSDAEADVAAALTGDLTFVGNVSESLAESTITWDTETGTAYVLKCTVAEAHRHAGVWSASKHRITLNAWSNWVCDETTNGHLKNFVTEFLQFTGVQAQDRILINDGGDAGGSGLIYQNNIFYNLDYLLINDAATQAVFRNNVLTEFDDGMQIRQRYNSPNCYLHIYNNTVCKSTNVGILESGTTHSSVHIYLRNNIAYGNGTDYSGTWGDGYITVEKNVSKDTTSPNSAYREWDPDPLPFNNYAGSDYTLAATDTTLDDGDDLSAIGTPGQFSIDIESQTRSTWFIGASEYIAAGGGGTIALSLDSYLSKTATVTLSCDALLQSVTSISGVLDAILSKVQTGSLSLDALLHGIGVTKTSLLDALLNKTGLTAIASLDAILFTSGEETISTALDACFNKTGLTATLGFDALLRCEVSIATSLDAVVAGEQTIDTGLDALLKRQVAQTVLLDALLKQADVTVTTDLDALLFAQATGSTVIDAVLTATVAATVLLDACLSHLNRTSTTSLDAVIYDGTALAGPSAYRFCSRLKKLTFFAN